MHISFSVTGPHKQEWDKARSNFRGPQNPLLEEVDEGGSMVEGVVKFKIHITARKEGGRGTSFTAGGIGSDVRALMTHSVPSFLFFRAQSLD